MKKWLVVLATALLAVTSLFVIVVAQESDASYWIALGDDLALNRSDIKDALAAYDNATRIDPGNIGAWDRKAMCLWILSQEAYRKVLNLTETRLAEYPQDARTWQAQAVAQASLGMKEAANRSIEKAIEIYDKEIYDDPGNATAWFYKAELTANRTDALSAYEKVIELNGSMKATSLLTKGNILLNLGKAEEAVAAIDEAVLLDQNDIQSWSEMALACYVLGRYNESLAAYEKMTDLNPENALAWKGKGDILLAMGQEVEASAAFARARELGYQGVPPANFFPKSITVT